jgi:hypothetical protein
MNIVEPIKKVWEVGKENISHVAENRRVDLEKLTDRPLREFLVIYSTLGALTVGGAFLAHEMKEQSDCTPMPATQVHDNSTGC